MEQNEKLNQLIEKYKINLNDLEDIKNLLLKVKPKYDELENKNKNKKLKQELSLYHNTLSKYLKDSNLNLLHLLIGTKAPFKLENYFGQPLHFLDWDNPNIKHYKDRYFKTIGVVDSE